MNEINVSRKCNFGQSDLGGGVGGVRLSRGVVCVCGMTVDVCLTHILMLISITVTLNLKTFERLVLVLNGELDAGVTGFWFMWGTFLLILVSCFVGCFRACRRRNHPRYVILGQPQHPPVYGSVVVTSNVRTQSGMVPVPTAPVGPPAYAPYPQEVSCFP